MIQTIKEAILPNCNMSLSISTYTDVNDVLELKLTIPAMTLDNYKTRHVIVHGGFISQFPNSTEPEETGTFGGVFPTKDRNITEFKISPTEVNSAYYCVVPAKGLNLQQTTVDLNANETMTINKLNVGFVFGNSFKINGEEKSGYTIAACENSDAIVEAIEPCKVISFFAGI